MENLIKSAVMMLLALVLSMSMTATVLAEGAAGDGITISDEQGENGQQQSKTIEALQLPEGAQDAITANYGTTEENLGLPEKLQATFVGGLTEEIPVQWIPKDNYDETIAGDYVFQINKDQLDGYQFAEGLEMPTVTVTVKGEGDVQDPQTPEKKKTVISGVWSKKTVSLKKTKTLLVKAAVTPAGGRVIRLEEKQNGKWVTRISRAMSGGNPAAVTLTFPKNWYKKASSVWRIYVPETDEYTSEAKVMEIKTLRRYQNGKRYFQIKDSIPTRKTTYNLKVGRSGYKVYLAQRRLHCLSGNYQGYTYYTKMVVKKFQRRHNLRPTGVIDLRTWQALGFSKKSWYYADSYTYPIQVDRASSKKDHIEAMIKTAYKYKGTRYVWCAAAKPGQGVDCAGLVIQSLYAAGIDPLPQGSHVYALKKNERTTARLWRNRKLKHVRYSQRRRGDIIYYHGHVSIYLGGNKMIEAMPGGVRVVRARPGIGCMRVFN